MKQTLSTIALIVSILISNPALAQKKQTHAKTGVIVGSLVGLAAGTFTAVSLASIPCEYDCDEFDIAGTTAVIGMTLLGAGMGGLIGLAIPKKSIQVKPLILNQADGMYSGASVNVRF